MISLLKYFDDLREKETKEIKDKFSHYTSRQKRFWNVEDTEMAKFERIYLGEDRSENAWNKCATKATEDVLYNVEPEKEWTVLEIGCGIGRVINQLRERMPFRRLIGVDISESMIKIARENLNHDERIVLYVNNGYDLSMISDSTVDFAYSVDTFIHIFDIDLVLNYLREVRRVLKEEGRFHFNVRRFDPCTSFSNSLGGRLAKWIYKLGIWSSGWHRWNLTEPAEFNGNQYMIRDIKKLARNSRLLLSDIRVDGSHFWCTMEKHI